MNPHSGPCRGPQNSHTWSVAVAIQDHQDRRLKPGWLPNSPQFEADWSRTQSVGKQESLFHSPSFLDFRFHGFHNLLIKSNGLLTSPRFLLPSLPPSLFPLYLLSLIVSFLF